METNLLEEQSISDPDLDRPNELEIPSSVLLTIEQNAYEAIRRT